MSTRLANREGLLAGWSRRAPRARSGRAETLVEGRGDPAECACGMHNSTLGVGRGMPTAARMLSYPLPAAMWAVSHTRDQ